jgi:hypothetical protein
MAEGGVLARASRPRRYSQGWRSRYRESLPCHRLLSSRRHCSTCDPPHEQLLARLGTGGAAFIVGGGCRVVPRGVRWCWDCSSPLSSSGSTLVLALTRLITGVGCVPSGYPTSWVSLLLSSPSRHPSLSAVATHVHPASSGSRGWGRVLHCSSSLLHRPLSEQRLAAVAWAAVGCTASGAVTSL